MIHYRPRGAHVWMWFSALRAGDMADTPYAAFQLMCPGNILHHYYHEPSLPPAFLLCSYYRHLSLRRNPYSAAILPGPSTTTFYAAPPLPPPYYVTYSAAGSGESYEGPQPYHYKRRIYPRTAGGLRLRRTHLRRLPSMMGPPLARCS